MANACFGTFDWGIVLCNEKCVRLAIHFVKLTPLFYVLLLDRSMSLAICRTWRQDCKALPYQLVGCLQESLHTRLDIFATSIMLHSGNPLSHFQIVPVGL